MYEKLSIRVSCVGVNMFVCWCMYIRMQSFREKGLIFAVQVPPLRVSASLCPSLRDMEHLHHQVSDLYICMYVLCVFIYAHECVCEYTCSYLYVFTHMHAHIMQWVIWMYLLIHVCTHTDICLHLMCICPHTDLPEIMAPWVHFNMPVCVHLYKHTHTSVHT